VLSPRTLIKDSLLRRYAYARMLLLFSDRAMLTSIPCRYANSHRIPFPCPDTSRNLMPLWLSENTRDIQVRHWNSRGIRIGK
jgi:hypothetical protein